MRVAFWIYLGCIGSLMTLISYTAKAEVTSLQGSVRDVPFFTEIMRDPALEKQKFLDELTAETTYERWIGQRNQLSQAKGKQRINLLSEMLNESVHLVYYLEDVALGRISVTSKDFKLSLKQARLNLAKYGRMLGNEKSATKSIKAKAIFHGNLADYMSGRQQSARIKELEKLAGLNGYLSRRRDFIVAWHALRIGDKTDSEKAVRSMAGMLRSFPLLASVSVRLIIGRYYAGISTSGRKFAEADKSYRKYLWAAADRMKSQPELEQEKVLQYITLVWKISEGKNIDWSNPPFKMKSFPTSKATFAIVERSAIQDLQKGSLDKAATKFQLLSGAFEGSPQTKDFDDRIILAREKEYRLSRDSRKLEAVLTEKIAKYSDKDVLGGKGNSEAVKASYELKHRKLADTEIRAAKNKRAPKVQQKQAIAMAQNIFANTQDPAVREKYALEIGYIYHVHGEYSKAVAQFMDMALNGQKESKYKFYSLAARSQGNLAKWPMSSPPWQGFPKGDAQARLELTEIFSKMDEIKKDSWFVKGHLGLLYYSISEKQKALDLWSSAIENLPADASASFASGVLLTEYEGLKAWEKLEQTARTDLKRGIKPVYIKTKLNPHQFLAVALLEGGKSLLEAGNSKDAVKKLAEFTGRYKTHPRHHEGFYHYALALHSDKKFVPAITKLQEFAEAYPQSPYHKPALYQGSSWSVDMAMEEKAIYFMQGFVLKYNDDENAQYIRSELVELYKGKLLYRQAAQVYSRMSEDKKLDPELIKNADEQRLLIELQQNSATAATPLANEFIKKYSNDPDMQMLSYATLAIAAGQKGQLKEMTRYEEKMNTIEATSRENQELLGWVRYLRASVLGKAIGGEIQAVALKEPRKHMETRFQKFMAMKKQFDSVCVDIQSSYCAGAMFDLARTSEESGKAFEDYQIAETLDKKTVDSFYARKSEIIKTITQISIAANVKSIELVASGESQPSHVRQVLWFNSADWTFEGGDTDGGHGFVQWRTAE